MTGGCPRETTVKIRVGYELIYDCPQPSPMMLVLNVHYTRSTDILVADRVTTEPSVLLADYRDGFGNWCTRLVAPKGQIRISSTAVVEDSGEPDIVATSAHQHSIQDLPDESLVFLLGSRYCDTQRLSETAWSLFGRTPAGWARVDGKGSRRDRRCHQYDVRAEYAPQLQGLDRRGKGSLILPLAVKSRRLPQTSTMD